MRVEEKILEAFNIQAELLEKQGNVIINLKNKVDLLEKHIDKTTKEYLKLYTVFQARLVHLEQLNK